LQWHYRVLLLAFNSLICHVGLRDDALSERGADAEGRSARRRVSQSLIDGVELERARLEHARPDVLRVS